MLKDGRISPAFSKRLRKVTVEAQALTPYLMAPSLPITVAALARRRWGLAAASGAVAATFLAISRPLLRPPAQPPAAPGERPLRVLNANLQYSNRRIGDVVKIIAFYDVDVIALIEYTAAHARVFRSSNLTASHPHRIESPDPGPGGAALWSRFPLTQVDAPAAEFPTIAAVLGASTPITMYALHPPNPLKSLRNWRLEHGLLADLTASAAGPTMLVGDFNASFWHPEFRQLLDAGWRDAHQLLGRGFTTSWPTDRFPVPPFVRLDHALVNDRLVAVDITNFRIPGSDHTGFVVSVAPAA